MTTTKLKPIRIDKLTPGSLVDVEFVPNSKRSYIEELIFLGVTGEGDDRDAHFSQIRKSHGGTGEPAMKMFTWQAYRYNGRWAFGTSAEPLRVIRVIRVLAEEA